MKLVAFTVALASPLALTSALLAADAITIRNVAPAKSFGLIAADDVQGSVERFKKTPLYELWKSEEVQKAVAEDWKKFQDGIDKRLQELSLPEDTLSWPKSAGFSFAFERNEELDRLESVFLFMADWGDGADKMSAFFDASFSEMMKETPDRITTKEIRGRKATILKMPDRAPAEPSPFGPDPFEALTGGVSEIVYARDGSRFLLASNAAAMEEALTAIDVPPAKLITDEEDARGALSQLGSGDVIALLRTGPLQPFLEEMPGGMAPAGPILSQLFGDIQAYGFSADVDGSVGMLDSKITVFTPGGRKGLLSLLSEAPAKEAPAFVPSDAIGYGHIGVAFNEIMKVVESTVASLPAEMAEQVDPMLQTYGPTLSKAFAALGPDIHTFTTVSQPITPESESNTTAISCSDEQAVLPLVTQFAPMLGLESRDFLGQTIFSAEFSPIAVGFGGGHMIIGKTANVEQVLRAASEAGGASTARSGAEKSSMALLPSKPLVGWGWYDTAAGFEVMRKMLLSSGGDGETADFVDEQGGQVVEEMVGVDLPTNIIDTLQKMDPEFIARFVGPQLWQFSADGKGLSYRLSLLRPKPPEAK